MIKFYSLETFNADTSRHLFVSWGWRPVQKPDDADIIIFNGGADIGTEIYNEDPVDRRIPKQKSPRDMMEINLYNDYKNSGKTILGICRGAQLLNCLNGGSLWQHTDNHGHDHDMIDVITGKRYEVTSTHHQMMRPNLKTGQIIGLSSESYNKYAQGVHEKLTPSDNLMHGQDVEIVFYPEHKTLCVQGHPEYVPGSRFAEYIHSMVSNLMEGGQLYKVAS